MASNIPASLKSADIGRFALRAAQLERTKPVVAYWCNFWIVNQIIERGLHTSDGEVKLYTTELVDKLEQFKNENPDNDAVTDAVAANAYVEQFALEVFGRAEATMKANRVTRQTADTFQAAATFLELCQIWNPPEAEMAAKIKFAKYHAVRIIKAIKAGEDPNASNPVAIEEEEDEGADLEPKADDPEVQAIVGTLPTQPRQPSVEDVVDDAEQASQAPLTLPDTPNTTRDYSSGHQRTMSPSGVKAEDDTDHGLELPSAPETFASLSDPVPDLPDTPGKSHAPAPSDSFHSFPPPSNMGPATPSVPSHDASYFYSKPSPSAAVPPPFVQSTSGTVPIVARPAHQNFPSPTPPAPAPAAPLLGSTNAQPVDDQAIALAQKHARWAVSALTFDDINTAIKELRNSLRYLGAE
ncbi:uncharacterized protein BP01DRAFT_370622 [Aspergillus saccharolyticus JOP 1030-1]|uniref:DUF605-domain-containing protein n=1 Tax=Aspergillus saccharolyticus JOP 1030-1 TaxID=1450539 RepID=A0A318ZQZ2_9EURO|nr:DUF605-domain-containing protein [Aspergillus saccharolyticus JOP 1030-1]PYH50039.1 DUF605-domain-containing protein [Aspergillus saccharolyticus JOP 1030-1]